jgi:predicted DNA-binding protein (UPF0251 family)
MPRARAKAKPAKKAKPKPAKVALGCTPEKLEIIKRLAAKGFLANEIADILGISRMTMWRWRAMEPGVAQALVIGHEAANARVELAVYQMAIGYERDEQEIKVIDGAVVMVPVKRYYPPNASAAALWTRHKMQWTEDGAPPPTETPDDKPVEVRQLARQVARLLHIASKETQQ